MRTTCATLSNQSIRTIAIALGIIITASTPPAAWAANRRYCTQTARSMLRACSAEIKDDYYVRKAACLNFEDQHDRRECDAEAREEKAEATRECRDVYGARRAVCGAIGEERYDPDLTPANFVSPDAIGNTVEANPFFPLVPGYRWVYQDQIGEEQITVTITDKIKLIEGISTRVVTDVVEKNGFAAEITDDWYAQDLSGNVWYLGESTGEYEVFPGDLPLEPELVEIAGSWKTGRDDAKPGIAMFRFPAVGATYRQEVLWGDAEDVAQIVSITGTESTPGGSCSGNCLITLEYTPLSPGINELKFYAPGIGFILELDAEGNRIELIDFQQG